MHIQMGIGHNNALLVKNGFDLPVCFVLCLPEILGFAPNPKHIGNGAVPVAFQSCKGLRVCQHRGQFRNLQQGIYDLLGIAVIRGGHIHRDPTGAVGGKVDDLLSGDGAVGNGYLLIVSGGKLGIGQTDLHHRAGLTGNFHEIPGVKGVGGQKHKAADHIGQHILQGEGKRQCQHAGKGDHAGHIHTHHGQRHEQQYQIQHDPHHGLDQTVGGFFHFCTVQRHTYQSHHNADHHHTDDKQQYGRQQLAQRKGAEPF